MATAALHRERRTTFRDRLEKAKKKRRSVSTFLTGGAGAGKTLTSLKFLMSQQGGIIPLDGGTGLEAFFVRTFPEQLDRMHPVPFGSMEELADLAEDLVNNEPDLVRENPNWLVDDMTPAFRREVERKKRLKLLEQSNPAEAERLRRSEPDHWERYMLAVMEARREFGVNLCMTSQGRLTFRQENGVWVPNDLLEANVQGEMFYLVDWAGVIRVSEADDAQKDEREAVTIKTRYPEDYPEFSLIRRFGPQAFQVLLEVAEPGDRAPLALVTGAEAQPKRTGGRGSSKAEPRGASQAELRDRAQALFTRLKKLGSTSRGGIVETEDAREMAGVLEAERLDARALDEVERKVASYEEQKAKKADDLGW